LFFLFIALVLFASVFYIRLPERKDGSHSKADYPYRRWWKNHRWLKELWDLSRMFWTVSLLVFSLGCP